MSPGDLVLPPDADDVALAEDGGGPILVVASAASLGDEIAFLATAGDAAGAIAIGAAGAACFRPAICRQPDGALALACGPGQGISGLDWAADREPRRWRLALPGQAWHLALAAGDPPWLAIELRRPGERWIALGRIDPASGAFAEVLSLGGGATWCRWPAIALRPGGGCLLAWCEGGARQLARVRFAAIAASGAAGSPLDADREPGEAPALAAAPDGSGLLAWHRGGAAFAGGGSHAASVRRQLRACRIDPDARATRPLAPPPAGPGGDDPRGEDQSWELAAVAVDPAGAVWLAGRSSHGHHLARLAGDRWSDRLALPPDGWGGRGRRLALLVRGGEVWYGRRAPGGIEVARCPLPTGTSAAAPDPIAPPPVRRRPAPRRRVLFGDLHQHTAHSDGCGSAEDLWIAARDGRGLDFAAVTDHDRFCRRSIGPATWQYLCDVADDFDEPGRFAAVRGYEFTGPRHPGPGHKCVYFADRVPDRIPDKEVAAVFAAVRAHDGIAVPHHVGWTGGDFSHHDPAVQPVWELCSVHGCYEHEACGAGPRPPRVDAVIPGQFVRDALDAGLRFGFIASTDHHGLDWHHGIAPRRNPLSCGLACLVDAEPTRRGVLDAMRARRTYGTSGARIELRVEVDGAPMGSALPAGTRGELAVEVDTLEAAPVARVVLVTAIGERVLDGAPDRRLVRRAPLPDADRESFYLYIRIELVDGEQAWASPFWVG